MHLILRHWKTAHLSLLGSIRVLCTGIKIEIHYPVDEFQEPADCRTVQAAPTPRTLRALLDLSFIQFSAVSVQNCYLIQDLIQYITACIDILIE